MTKVTVAGASAPAKRHFSALYRETVQQFATDFTKKSPKDL